ncbi:hypothetical protein EON80_13705 [bacterium]|nr:MAG: hypothetical protein EON80_13705 [bacterium]
MKETHKAGAAAAITAAIVLGIYWFGPFQRAGELEVHLSIPKGCGVREVRMVSEVAADDQAEGAAIFYAKNGEEILAYCGEETRRVKLHLRDSPVYLEFSMIYGKYSY